MKIRKTRSGWVREITHRKGGCLEVGGVCGREVLYTRETLANAGIEYDADPQSTINEHGTTIEQYLAEQVEPDRVLRAGTVIR